MVKKLFSVIMFLSALSLLAILGPGPAGAEGEGGAGKPEPSPRLIIIDDDVAMLKREVASPQGGSYVKGAPITDPDGGLELIYALKDPGVQVLGITCEMGCSSAQVCMDSVKKILELTGRPDIPVLRGADSAKDLGRPTDAARFIVDAVMGRPGQVEIIATGPLTNLATALMIEPCLPQNWKALHVATGEFMGALGERSDAVAFRWIGYKDLNINADPAAMRYVLDHGGDFSIYPNEVMDEAWLTPADRQRIKAEGTPLALFVADETSPHMFLDVSFGRLFGWRGFNLHGVIPVAIVLDPALAEPPQPLRVAMTHNPIGGYSFSLSPDPANPLRPVFTRLREPKLVQERLMQRCK